MFGTKLLPDAVEKPRNIKTTEFNAELLCIQKKVRICNSEVLEKEENFKKLEQCMETLPGNKKQA